MNQPEKDQINPREKVLVSYTGGGCDGSVAGKTPGTGCWVGVGNGANG